MSQTGTTLVRPMAGRDFLPSQIAGVRAWLDASDSTTITLNGSTVSAWANKIAGNPSFSQTTASRQPAYATNVLNGLPVVRFDGVDDTMSSTPLFSATPCSVIALVRFLASREIGAVYSQTPSNVVLYRWGNGGGVARLYNGTDLTTSGSLALNVWHGFTGTARGSTSEIWFGYTIGTRGNSGTQAVTGNSFIGSWQGGPQFQNCEIAEMVCVSRAISSVERQLLLSYWRRKWGVTLT